MLTLSIILLLMIGFVFALRFSFVQSRVGSLAAHFLSRELRAEIQVESLYFEPFSSLQIRGLYISDQQGDTLLYAPTMKAKLDLTRFLQGQLTINDVSMSDAVFRLHLDTSGNSNLRFLVDYFGPDPSRQRRSRKIQLVLEEAALENATFIYLNEQKIHVPKAGLATASTRDDTSGDNEIDFNNLHVRKLSGQFSDIDFGGHLLQVRVENLSLIEQSGFEIIQLNTQARIDTQQIELRGLELRTNRSTIGDYLLFTFRDYGDFRDFLNKVNVQLELDHARIASRDIAYFAPVMHQIEFDIRISGSLQGRVAALEGRQLDVQLTPDTRMQGEVSIQGLPDIDRTLFDLHIQRLLSHRSDIEKLVFDLGQGRQLQLPKPIEALGKLQFSGTFSGLYHDFRANGKLQTELGLIDVNTDIDLQSPTSRYEGSLGSEDFGLGQFLNLSAFGKSGFFIAFSGAGFDPRSMLLDWDARVEHLELQGYRYRNLHSEGSLLQQQLESHVHLRDPNLQAELRAQIDLQADSRAYGLEGEVRFADLHALDLSRDRLAMVQRAQIRGLLRGNDLNDLEGELAVTDFLIDRFPDRFTIDETVLTAHGLGDKRRIEVRSDLFQVSASGQIDLVGLWPALKAFAHQYIPVWDLPGRALTPQHFDFSATVHDFRPISAFFAPTLSLETGTHLQGQFSTRQAQGSDHAAYFATISAQIPAGRWSSLEASELDLHVQADQNELRTDLSTAGIRYNEFQPFDRLEFQQRLVDNRASYQIRLADSTDLHQTQLNGHVHFLAGRLVSVATEPSEIRLDGSEWQVSEARIGFRKGSTHIEGLAFRNRDQQIRIDGAVSAHANDQLRLVFDRFEMRNLAPFIPDLRFEIYGRVTGQTQINSLLAKPWAVANLSIEDVALDEARLGNMLLQADFNQDEELVNLSFGLQNHGSTTLAIEGRYHINRPSDHLDLVATFTELDVDVLEILLRGLIQDVRGTLSGRAQIQGTLRNAKITGEGSLRSAHFRVPYLNVPYQIAGTLRMENSQLYIDGLQIVDPRNRRGLVRGSVDLRHPTNPSIDIRIDANNLMVLNTSLQDNPLYYGTAFGTGQFQFHGSPQAMNIAINARTEENTVFHIPLNSSTVLGDSEFIRFISFAPRDDAGDAGPMLQPGLLSGLNMNMDLHVTPATLANIHTDLGELSGRGEGQINLRISSLGDFEMFGDYQVNSGKFTFSAQDFINKIFEIKPGGHIRWTGRPTDASIGLTAFYEQRTSLSALYDAAGRTPNDQRILTRAEMDLSGNLLRPTINFGLDFPADPYVKDELQSYLSDANNVNQQALSLIVRRSFLPGSSSDFSRELNSTLLSAGTELAFNQLNTLISQSLNLNFIDLNIRSLNDASASLRFFDDRLIFTGGITDLRAHRLNDLNVFSDRVATDTELRYLIRKDGRLILRGSNRLNTRHFLLNPSDEYISALGLVYRQEFDSFEEFFRRILFFQR